MPWAGPRARTPWLCSSSEQRAAVLTAVEKLLGELQRLSKVGNDTLRPRLEQCLRGHARAEGLLARVQAAQEQLPAVDDDFLATSSAPNWKPGRVPIRPHRAALAERFDHAAAVARPAITVSLAVSGWVRVAGDLVGQAGARAVDITAGHLATEAAIAGGITGGGEALVSPTSEGVGQAAARLFRRLQVRWAQQGATGWPPGWNASY